MLDKILALITIFTIIFLFAASAYLAKVGAENIEARARVIEEVSR